jgi:hypothetical protein
MQAGSILASSLSDGISPELLRSAFEAKGSSDKNKSALRTMPTVRTMMQSAIAANARCRGKSFDGAV